MYAFRKLKEDVPFRCFKGVKPKIKPGSVVGRDGGSEARLGTGVIFIWMEGSLGRLAGEGPYREHCCVCCFPWVAGRAWGVM